MDYEERQRRLDRARIAIWAELLLGLTVVILTSSVSFDASPWGDDPMSGYMPAFLQLFVLVAPAVSLLAWLWMLRLSRPRPEAGERSWRYHDGSA
jgi:protein-S-isoprenylcysteine O-methyltransferase Ste14